jgi:5-formyltetrahydrofolate cyclo-ligase
MISGIGFQEIIFIAVLILIFFGPKGVSGIMRDLGRFVGSLKKYRDEFTRELMAISEPELDEAALQKNERKRIRKVCKTAMEELEDEEREKENKAILSKITDLKAFQKAQRIFIYLSLPSEADTFRLIENGLQSGKKVFVPFCKSETLEIGISEIKDVKDDVEPGIYNIPEPKTPLRTGSVDPLSINLFIIPGIAFDHDLMRLGRGKGYFDRFLKNIKGKKDIWALAFDEQIYPYSIPKYDHDICADLIITPNETIKKEKKA